MEGVPFCAISKTRALDASLGRAYADGDSLVDRYKH
jgi:hypothetical protein